MIDDGGCGNDTGGREVSDDDDGEDGTCVIIQSSVDEDNDCDTDYCFTDDDDKDDNSNNNDDDNDALKYCSCTYNDTVFSDVDIRSHLGCIYNTVLFNNYMISNMKRKECNPKTNIITNDKYHIFGVFDSRATTKSLLLQVTYCCMMWVYMCTSLSL